MKLEDIRKNYSKSKLERENLALDPIKQFENWLSEVLESEQLEPTAMVLSTIKPDQMPSSRVVLLKGIEDKKFRFFTNYSSHKALEMDNNNNVSALFFWPALERQVRVEGTVLKSKEEVSNAYFKSRPIQSQAGAIASKQSSLLEDKQTLISDYLALKEKKSLERPENWGGYEISPRLIEFWQGGEHRLHDRFTYEKQNDNSWLINRLYP